MNKKTIIYLLLIFASLAAYFYHQESDEEIMLDTPIDLSEQPLYQSGEMMSIFYDLSGKPSYKVLASQVEHFDNNKETIFKSPSITLYDKTGVAKWHIQANNALLTHDKILHLNGDARLNNLSPDIQLQRILTEKAEVNLVTQIVTSKEKVTIQGANFTSQGVGLLGDLKEKTAKILENVTTNYGTSLSNTTQ